jgi:ATP-dependent 26S proteasome regulatory subunit
VFLLTTNRPQVLEPALSARPGRVDQAVEFPLPDEDCRRRLFALYGRGLDLTGADLERWVARTERASPAFLEELLRRAVLMAAERGEQAEPPRVRDEDLEKALGELVYFGGEMTQKLLGFRSSGSIGFRPAPRDTQT